MKPFSFEIESKTIQLKSAHIEDLLVTAFEGGINYWCGRVSINDVKNPNYRGNLASEILPLGGDLTLYDAVTGEKWLLTLDMMVKGIKMYCEVYCEPENYDDTTFMDTLIDEHDAQVADMIVQLALFDEIVFG